MLTYSRPDALKPDWITITKIIDMAIGISQRRIDEHNLEVLITLALVFGTYSLALHLHLSGPIAVVVSWVFEWTAEGVTRDSGSEPGAAAPGPDDRRTESSAVEGKSAILRAKDHF